MPYGFPAKVCRTTIFYHITNIHNNEDTGQIAHSAYARNATPSAKMAISSGFGMMLPLFSVAGLSRPPCLIHHSPPVGRAISVCRRKRRQIAICGRFPDPVRCVLLQRLVRQLARFSRRAEDESNGFLRLAATGWALFSRLNDASGSFRPLRGCPGHDSRFPAHLRSCWRVSRFIQPSPHPYSGCPGIVQCPCG